MSRFRLAIAALLVLLTASCDLTTEPQRDGPLEVEARGSALHLSNRGSLPIHFLAFEREITPLIFWGPCTEPSQCPTVAPGEKVLLPYSSIGGYEPGKQEAVVYWWHLVPKEGGGFRPDSIRAVVVGL